MRTIAVSAVLLLLANSSVVHAAYTSTLVGTTATMTGDAAGDTLSITQEAGLFKHNRRTAGDVVFNSDFDFNTVAAGDQTLSAATAVININAGDGSDTIALGDGINLRGVVDGGPGGNQIDYSAYTTAIRANLGLRTTVLSATLGADQEAPATTHAGTGTATITNYNVSARTFNITVTVSNLPPGDVTGFHIHQALVGANGPIIVDFSGVAPLTPVGTGFTFTATGLTLPSTSEAAFLGGGTYVNIHTAAFPGGAIRGQLFAADSVNLATGAATGTTSLANFERVTGGPGGDSLVGSFSANTFFGGDGADWIVGGPGNDVLFAGAGADVLVWSNGDGNDVMQAGPDGDPGDTVQINGSTTAADEFGVSANGSLIRIFVNQVFILDNISGIETLTVNGIGGNDTFGVQDLTGVAVLTTVNLNGFDGSDTFTYVPTSAGAFVFNAHGGTGADTLQGPNGASTWNVTAANAGNVAGLVTSFRFIETLTGGTGSDIFNVKAFATGALTVTGGAGSDTLNYDAELRTVSGDTTPPDGVINSLGVQPVTFTQIEAVNLANVNTPPTITAIANQTIAANSSTAALPFTIGDLETAASGLIVSTASSDTTLVPLANIVIGGSGANRTVTVTPTVDRVGTATITVTVSDGILSTPSAFLLTVNAPTTVQPPTGLYVSAMSGNLVTFRFKAAALGPPATGFVLEGGLNPGQVVAGIPTGSDAPIFSVVAPTGSFFVRMHATRGAEKSAASNEIRIHVNMPVPPSAPDMFRSAPNGNGLVLAWRNTFDGGPPASLTLDVGGSVVAQIPLGLTETLAVTGVPPGTYALRLRSVNGGGASPPSSAVTLTIPSACPGPPEVPSNFLAYRVGNTANVVWDPPLTGPAASSYKLNVTGSFVGSFPTTLRALGGQAGPGSYTVSVVAVNPCGSSPATPSQTIVIP